jgi:hypothetical protein
MGKLGMLGVAGGKGSVKVQKCIMPKGMKNKRKKKKRIQKMLAERERHAKMMELEMRDEQNSFPSL